MIDESTIDSDNCIEDLGGCVGMVFIDHQPKATPARIRPFIWAYLLLRGAVRRSEVEQALAGHVATDDNRIFDDRHGRTRLAAMVDDVLGTMVFEGLLRVNGHLYVLKKEGMTRAVSATCTLNAQLPDHLLMEIDGSS